MISSLFFADAHVEPGQDLKRATALGRFIVDRKPDNIVDLGDTFSMTAISGWDNGKGLTMEGKRYKDDVAAATMFTNKLFGPLKELNEQQRNNKVRLYRPFKLRMRGNHEDRESRFMEDNPQLGGHLDIDSMSGYTDNFDVVMQYKERYILNGINIMHCPLAGNGQPISGLHIPHKTLQRFVNHSITGHYHRAESSSTKRTDSEHLQRAIICPAFFDGQPYYLSPNAPATINRGVLMIHQMDSMVPEIEEISLERLYAYYS